ncbi:hypothetical protein [Taibaiella soli]|nr:hypothetical protein [Taibaiella soli]
MTTFQLFSIFSPIFAAITVAFFTFRYAIKSKKFDLLYASKIPAFKEVAARLTDFKMSCLGTYAQCKGMGFNPYEVTNSALGHRTEITLAVEQNAVFLSEVSRKEIDGLLNSIGHLCNIELSLAGGYEDDRGDYSEIYLKASEMAEGIINSLYRELNLI